VEDIRTAAATLYQNMVAMIHLKRIDGYGLEVQHCLLCGKMLLTDQNVYNGKTLGIPVRRWSYHVNYADAGQIASVFLDNVKLFREVARKQANWCREFFDYERNADSIKRFLAI